VGDREVENAEINMLKRRYQVEALGAMPLAAVACYMVAETGPFWITISKRPSRSSVPTLTGDKRIGSDRHLTIATREEAPPVRPFRPSECVELAPGPVWARAWDKEVRAHYVVCIAVDTGCERNDSDVMDECY
jgi:hypothetical protein